MEPLYLDYAATTPLRDEVRAAMDPFLGERFGNPSSIHRWGRDAAEALEAARASVATSLGARSSEIRFVRGGTESDNLAILGSCRALCARGARPRLLVSAVEHPAVIEAAAHAAATGIAAFATLPVFGDGTLDLGALEVESQEDPPVVSTMWVNNETGMILPVADVVRVVSGRGGMTHTDASQAVGKVPIDLAEVRVDLLTATGHKIYGPKGTGILFVRTGNELEPLLHGGGQERTIRPGTEDVAGAVGFATALRLALEELETEAARLTALRTHLEERLEAVVPGVRVNAGPAPRAPHVSSVGFEGIDDGSALVMALDMEGIAVSGGSACASGSAKASHVIEALYGPEDRHATVRFSFGRRSSEAHVDVAVAATARVVERARTS